MTDKNYRMADVFELPVTSKDVGVFVPPCCAEDEAEHDKAVAQAVNQHDSLVARVAELEGKLKYLIRDHSIAIENLADDWDEDEVEEAYAFIRECEESLSPKPAQGGE